MFLSGLPSAVWAVPGPDSTAIVANSNDPESVALAEAYRSARSIPRAQLCLLDLPEQIDLTLDEYRAQLLEPLFACLGALTSRIEAVVLMRGVPLRVAIPFDASRSERVSLAAALSLWRSTDPEGESLLGAAPGNDMMCGMVPCYAARWSNLYRSGDFYAGWEGAERDGTIFRPVLVTMLHGRSYEDAARLFDSALAGEELGGARGTFVFMNGADPARGAIDYQYARVIDALNARGFADTSRIAFDANATGLSMASFFVGTAGLGATIEGNTFLPGSIVDNLTSYGAVPENFTELGESQVSIARFVARGVAGVHGTTDEPLNNCFPARDLLIDYVDGFTLGEAYFASMPFVYWRNLVLGDVMAAPYATRPLVQLSGVTAGEEVAGERTITATASHPRGIARLVLYANGATVAEAAGDRLEAVVTLPLEEVELLAVAQAEGSPASKGWTMLTVRGAALPPDAGVEEDAAADAGLEDAGAPEDAHLRDFGVPVEPVDPEEEGCSCAVTNRNADLWISAWLAVFAAGLLRAIRLRRR